MSIFDTLCKRSLSFVQKCLKTENVLVNFVSRHAVFFSKMNSGIGRNVQFIVNVSIYTGKSFIYRPITNKSGPNTLRCGIPFVTCMKEEYSELTII